MLAALERTPGLARRLFCPAELLALHQARADGGSGAAGAVAGKLFATKEAVMKSLGVGFDVVPFRSIEVDPHLASAQLHDPAAALAEQRGVARFEIELGVMSGPEGPVAVAEVVALG